MFKRLLIPTLILAAALPVMAQKPGRILRQRVQQRQAARAIRLTPEQRQAVKSVMEANQPQRQAIRQEIKQKLQTLKDLQAQANPDPTALGNAMLALREVRGRVQQLRKNALNQLRGTLSDEQIQKLEKRHGRSRKLGGF